MYLYAQAVADSILRNVSFIWIDKVVALNGEDRAVCQIVATVVTNGKAGTPVTYNIEEYGWTGNEAGDLGRALELAAIEQATDQFVLYQPPLRTHGVAFAEVATALAAHKHPDGTPYDWVFSCTEAVEGVASAFARFAPSFLATTPINYVIAGDAWSKSPTHTPEGLRHPLVDLQYHGVTQAAIKTGVNAYLAYLRVALTDLSETEPGHWLLHTPKDQIGGKFFAATVRAARHPIPNGVHDVTGHPRAATLEAIPDGATVGIAGWIPAQPESGFDLFTWALDHHITIKPTHLLPDDAPILLGVVDLLNTKTHKGAGSLYAKVDAVYTGAHPVVCLPLTATPPKEQDLPATPVDLDDNDEPDLVATSLHGGLKSTYMPPQLADTPDEKAVCIGTKHQYLSLAGVRAVAVRTGLLAAKLSSLPIALAGAIRMTPQLPYGITPTLVAFGLFVVFVAGERAASQALDNPTQLPWPYRLTPSPRATGALMGIAGLLALISTPLLWISTVILAAATGITTTPLRFAPWLTGINDARPPHIRKFFF